MNPFLFSFLCGILAFTIPSFMVDLDNPDHKAAILASNGFSLGTLIIILSSGYWVFGIALLVLKLVDYLTGDDFTGILVLIMILICIFMGLDIHVWQLITFDI